MDAVRGVARKREARFDEAARQGEAQRPRPRLALDPDLAELQPETQLELGLEQERIGRDQPLGLRGPLGPHDR